MARVQTLASNPEKGPVRRCPAGRFDLAGLETAIEEAVCRAWEEEADRKKKGVASMVLGNEQEPTVSASRDLCQEVLARVLAAAEEKAVGSYQRALSEAQTLDREMSRIRGEIAAAQGQVVAATLEAQERAEAKETALREARATAQEALVPYIAAGVIAPEEVEEHLEGALAEARAQLHARRQEAEARLAALQGELERLKARQTALEARREALQTRLAELRSLPCIAALERARHEEEARRKEAAQAAIRFLETAPWHELSWQKRLTPRMKEAVALAGEDPLVFGALVERLGREIDSVDAATRPGLGWSVVRAIEALEMERLFPNLDAKRAELAQAAQRYHQQRQAQGQAPMADKIVSLASRWGARVAIR